MKESSHSFPQAGGYKEERGTDSAIHRASGFPPGWAATSNCQEDGAALPAGQDWGLQAGALRW